MGIGEKYYLAYKLYQLSRSPVEYDEDGKIKHPVTWVQLLRECQRLHDLLKEKQ